MTVYKAPLADMRFALFDLLYVFDCHRGAVGTSGAQTGGGGAVPGGEAGFFREVADFGFRQACFHQRRGYLV